MSHDIKVQIMLDGEWTDLEEAKHTMAYRRIERALERIQAHLDHVVRRVNKITFMEGRQMASMQEIIDLITPLKSKVEGLNVLMDSMRNKIAELLAGEIVPPALQAKIDAVFTEAKGVADEIQVAIDENTPVEPPPVPPPVDPPVDGEV